MSNNIDWQDFSQKVSKYFTVGEVLRFDKSRVPTNAEHQKNIIELAKALDILREKWGGPIGVTSWYRPPAVNRRVGGVRNSQHLLGSAVDIYPIGGNIFEFQKFCDQNWPGAVGYGAKRGFVHLDMRSYHDNVKADLRWNYV